VKYLSWFSLEEIKDEEEFMAGTAFKFFKTQDGYNIGHVFPASLSSLDYIMLPFNLEYMALICLSIGEEGNTTRHLKAENKLHKGLIVSGCEIKRMLLSNLEKVFINPNPKYIVDDLPIKHK